MDKKIINHQPRTLVIEDEHGMKTSYYPSLIWNGMVWDTLFIQRKKIFML